MKLTCYLFFCHLFVFSFSRWCGSRVWYVPYCSHRILFNFLFLIKCFPNCESFLSLFLLCHSWGEWRYLHFILNIILTNNFSEAICNLLCVKKSLTLTPALHLSLFSFVKLLDKVEHLTSLFVLLQTLIFHWLTFNFHKHHPHLNSHQSYNLCQTPSLSVYKSQKTSNAMALGVMSFKPKCTFFM